MTLSEIRNECWSIARETSTIDQDRLWNKADMNRYINRIYNYIAKETLCIRDSMTTAVCRITVDPPNDITELTDLAATDAYYAQDLAWYNDSESGLYGKLVAPYSFPLHESILQIDECKWTTVPLKLVKVSVTKWQDNPTWEQVIGLSTEYATDLDTGRIVLNLRRDTTDTLKLFVRRLPIIPLSEDEDVPEFRVNYHALMVNGILWQMYSKQDAETVDKTKADQYYLQFLKDVDEIKQQETVLNMRLNQNYSMAAFR